MIEAENLNTGAENLIENCANLVRGETVLVVREDPSLGWYDAAAPEAAITVARKLGIEPSIMDVGGPQSKIDPVLIEAVRRHDCTIFFARIGDQDRFAEPPPGCRSVMVYSRDAGALASAYGRTDHRAMVEVKRLVNELCAGAETIRITCPLGTELNGVPDVDSAEQMADVSVARFPLAVPAPVIASGFSGRVALANYLTTTGSMPYEPSAIPIDDIVFAEISAGRIKRFTGPSQTVERIEHHYDRVAELFQLDRNNVHSWHAGIHPACAYHGKISDDPDRWSNNIFANPRFLHFHTCGDYAPGEICWMVLDPTIGLDGVSLWENGKLCLSNFERAARQIEKWPQLKQLLDNPETRIGL